MHLRLDNVEVTYKVEKHKAVGLLIDLGGLQKSIMGILFFFTLIASRNLFENDILDSLY